MNDLWNVLYNIVLFLRWGEYKWSLVTNDLSFAISQVSFYHQHFLYYYMFYFILVSYSSQSKQCIWQKTNKQKYVQFFKFKDHSLLFWCFASVRLELALNAPDYLTLSMSLVITTRLFAGLKESVCNSTWSFPGINLQLHLWIIVNAVCWAHDHHIGGGSGTANYAPQSE